MRVSAPNGVGEKPSYIMKNTFVILAAPLGVFAAAVLALSVLPHVNVETLVGYTTVLSLVGVATLEYRINWRRIFGR